MNCVIIEDVEGENVNTKPQKVKLKSIMNRRMPMGERKKNIQN